ncbi:MULTISPECIES: CRISPR-associated helicase Cas3' [unclassified Meiothermus]|uniref:CRISPR-associated helicase Cas3' n=1 Tax=unclassified Meiothermus TaxID=370471 RepID=UPI000D7CC95F|nr:MULTISPECIES: CRISPR-associated helicase Cas3' [unclassified Meiothermus]PZA06224.1 CRISPR-associated helicase/endonuclease Cas3 [Meiothermus sp. Pnk-1]RYM37442.1 CRISPR-associated helicase Cas3' [Meiothermus sp. PNK-Is4]
MDFRSFQTRAAEALKRGSSVLLHAPTGIGKSVGSALGFTQALPKNPADTPRNPLLGTRLLHVLPMRALASSVAKDIAGLLEQQGFGEMYRPAIHHGQQQESEIFAERVGVTTIDQYLAGFAGAPLSFSSRSGHAVAGAVVASYSVFDEVHLLGPERGLPLLYAVLQQRRRWGLLSTVMTATLPKSVRDFLVEQVGLEPVELTYADIQARDGWREVTLSLEEIEEPAERVLEEFKAHGRVIAFVNTVEAAIELYRQLQAKLGPEDGELFLVHSNFAPSHRKALEERLLEVFGRGSTARAVCVLTQVGEAGINISAPVVLSELAPIDSLIQRAGRCARFDTQPEGRFVVYRPRRERSHTPYSEDLVKRTEVALHNRGDGFRLDWTAENELVDEVLDAYYAHFIRGETVSRKDAEIKKAKKGERGELPQPAPKTKSITIADALGLLDQTFHSRSADVLEGTLREINNVQVVVVSEPPRNAAGAEIVGAEGTENLSEFERYLDQQNRLKPYQRDTLESIPVSYGRFARRLEEQDLWELKLVKEEEHDKPLYVLQRAERVRSNRTYLLTQADAGYSPTVGLSFGEVDYVEPVHGLITPVVPRDGEQDQPPKHNFQSWREHCSRVYRAVDAMLKSKYLAWILHIAKQMQARGVLESAEQFAQTLESMIRLAALLHDVGKLSRGWQREIGWREGTGEEFWAKSKEGVEVGELPPHAFHALPVLRYLFRKLGVVDEQGKVDRLAELIALAAARHHSLGNPDGTLQWPPFELHAGVLEEIRQLLQDELGEDSEPIRALITPELFDHINDDSTYKLEKGKHTYVLDTPSPSEDYYPFYVLANRMIKVGDWEASGEREVELCR